MKHTLEMLRNAGLRVWMLTGDKVETATCIAISAKLISRTQSIYTMCMKPGTRAEPADIWRDLNKFADEVVTKLSFQAPLKIELIHL